MISLFESDSVQRPTRGQAVANRVWEHLPAAVVVLAALISVSNLAWIVVWRAHAPVLLQGLSDSSVALSACLIGLYGLAFFFDLSRAKAFWMSREMGFYTVVAALFFAAGFFDLRLFAQSGHWDSGATEEWLVMGALWTSQFWKSGSSRELFSMAIGFRPSHEVQASETVELGLSAEHDSGSSNSGR